MNAVFLNFKNQLASILTLCITRKELQRFWTLLYKFSLRGMGVLNAGSDDVTGELWFINKLAQQKLDTIFDVGANTVVFGADVLNADDSELKETQPTSTLASLNKTVIENLHGQKAQGFTVDCVTLDSFAKAQKVKNISLLKIDVEGLELEVLKGASELLKDKKIELIQFEFNQMHVFQRVFFKDIVDLLSDYKLYRLSKNGLLPLGQYSPVTHEIFAFQNILAIRNDKVSYWEEILNAT